MPVWERLIRFEDDSGVVYYGEPIIADACDLEEVLHGGSLEAKGLDGPGPFDLTYTGAVHKVRKLLGLLTPDDVPIVKCVGLNYMKHSKLSARPKLPASTTNSGILARLL